MAKTQKLGGTKVKEGDTVVVTVAGKVTKSTWSDNLYVAASDGSTWDAEDLKDSGGRVLKVVSA